MSLPSLPSLPTDNLYKFMAITGVVLFVGAPVYWATFYFQLAEKETASQVARVELREQILEYAHLPPPPKRGEQLSPGVSEAWAKQRETVDTRRKELRLAEAQYTRRQRALPPKPRYCLLHCRWRTCARCVPGGSAKGGKKSQRPEGSPLRALLRIL